MKKVIIILIIIISLILLDGFFLNPHQLTIKNYAIDSPLISSSFNNFKISHFSDVLLGTTNTVKDLEKIVNKINKEEPDIIVFTGDLIYKDYKPSNEEVTKIKNILKKLDCSLYKYAVIGDNDEANIDLYKEIMSESDFILLDDKAEYLFYQDQNPIEIIGLTDINNIDSIYLQEEGITPSYYLILTHYPDYADSIRMYPANLILTGHSLGGQIKIPFFGGIIKKDKAQKYLNDSYIINDSLNLYVSNGLGCENINFRFLNTPSINFYTLKNVDN